MRNRKEEEQKLHHLIPALVFIGTGLCLFIISMLYAMSPGEDGSVLSGLNIWVSSIIGNAIVFKGDVTIALSLLLIFQGLSLFQNRGHGGILYALWLFIPFFLIVTALGPEEGQIPVALNSVFSDTLIVPLTISLIITMLFRALLVMHMPGKDEEPGKEQKQIGRDRQLLLEAPDLRKNYEKAEAERARLNDELMVRERRITELNEAIAKLSEVKPADSVMEKENLELKERAEKLEHELQVQGIIRSASEDAAADYTSLSKKRKELMALTPLELKNATKKLKGYQLYRKPDGNIENVKGLVDEMEAYTFSSMSFIIRNSKGSRKVIASEDLVVPAFSEKEAEELAIKEIEGYSKGGYRFSAYETKPEVTGTKLPIASSDFVMPWIKDITYDDPETADTLFLWDFHFKYAPDRKLTPYTGARPRKSSDAK